MKRVTLTKLLDEHKPIQAIKTLRESTRDVHSACSMGLKDAKDAVDALRAGGTPTVKVERPELLTAAFEFTVVPAAEHFHATHDDATVFIADNRSVGYDGCGEELFIEVADGDLPVSSWGILSASNVVGFGTLSREQAERLYDWLGDWLGK